MTYAVEARGLCKEFWKRDTLGRRRLVHAAVSNVEFTVEPGRTLGIVGESGAGKSTLGRMLLRLIEPDHGSITIDGTPLLSLSGRQLRQFRQRARMVFQDPFTSFDQRRPVGDAVESLLRVHLRMEHRAARVETQALFDRVGLRPDHLVRFPAEMSGGQLQRVAIARAIATRPALFVCDEPVAALDTSMRAQIVNLLHDLQDERDVAMVFITHDLSLVELIADNLLVMRNGRVVEAGTTRKVCASPTHEYTRELLAAIPRIGGRVSAT